MAYAKKKPLQFIKAILRAGENERIEFKRTFDNEAIETICAFANAHGGSIYIGVGDDGNIDGVIVGKESHQHWINQVKQTTSPSVLPDIIEHIIDGKTVIEIVTPEYPVKPVSYRGRYYRRAKNANHILTTAQVVDIHLKTFNTSWDHYPSERYSINDISLNMGVSDGRTARDSGQCRCAQGLHCTRRLHRKGI
jgi:ATP-dependent DNA helicase RecG